jgi:hypothetical protein
MSVDPLKRLRRWKGPIVGFDTEYTSKGRELVCFQLWTGDKGVLVPVKRGEMLTPAWLYQEVVRLVGDLCDPLLITYFSLAELQFLPVVSEGFNIREYGSGSLDVSFEVGYQHMHIFDLQRWFASPNKPLRAAAEAFGLQKLEYDTRHVTRSSMKSKKFRDYALHDAQVQHDIAIKLRDVFLEYAEVDPLIAKTPASASAMCLRTKFIRKGVYCDCNRSRRIAMEGTWGGHAEVFRRGTLKGKYQEWDLKSAYPSSAIKLGELPIQGSWQGFRSVHAARRLCGGFARVRFAYPKGTRYPCLPVWFNDSMLYPLQGETVCTLEELRQAVDTGCDVRVIEGRGYRRGTTALADYLQWTLDNRAEAKGGARHMWKLLGNSLIGKFAQNLHKVSFEKVAVLAEAGDFYIDELLELPKDELTALAEVLDVPDPVHVSVGPVFMPEWNGLITGYTRAALAELISTGEGVYCHTDSVWCRRKPKCTRLPFDLKTEGTVTIARTRFAGMGDKLTPKEVKAERSHVAHHSIWNLTAGCQMLTRFRRNGGADFVRNYPINRPLKLREAIKTGRTPGEWVKEWRKGNTNWDHKRALLRGGDTRPWVDIDEYADNLARVKAEAKEARTKKRKGGD